ncbi:MAG: YraN family protein [Victivallales bacterium]|jgi:putative endonuclease|nr:YraN family protein [Victivallales bacterium]
MKRARAAHIALGIRGESTARRLLLAKGYTILACNWRVRSGELDIVARDGATLVFVEVKTLRRIGRFRPGDNLSIRQMRRNFRAARYYFRVIGKPALNGRFDLIEVVIDRWGVKSIRHRLNYMPTVSAERHG